MDAQYADCPRSRGLVGAQRLSATLMDAQETDDGGVGPYRVLNAFRRH